MKTWGWILAVMGTLSFIGCIYKGNSVLGPTVFIALGIYLIEKARAKGK